ncbi:hypothetical protein [Lacipirellula sp.]|uniref:hypothetical protein n=1 Tax=Lacipirellula sp. TaxID=2691419 RepID=UPI003D1243BA
MSMQRLKLGLLASAAVILTASSAAAQTPGFFTGFEAEVGPGNPVAYTTGSLILQDGWDLGSAARSPRVQTAAEIAAELTTAGLNVGQTTHSGNSALLVSKENINVESSGYFVRDVFTGLESETKVTVNFWARPLTSGLGADPAGTPAGNNKTIGERQGNMFIGIADNNEVRAAAVRFGVDTSGADPYTNVLERHIDFASASAGAAVWVKSGQLWTADSWYNFKFKMDYTTKTYDFFVNGTKANADPIRFYTETSAAAQRFFVSRGTNQAGSIIDDISVMPTSAVPATPGDFNADGLVNGADFLLWQRDTAVGSLDDWKANFGAGATVAIGAVPEPATAALAVAAAIGLGVVGRKRR